MGNNWKLTTLRELQAEGYQHVATRACTYQPCEATIYIFRTPKGKLMPFDRFEREAADPNRANEDTFHRWEPHFGNCSGKEIRDQARKEGRSQESEAPDAKQRQSADA